MTKISVGSVCSGIEAASVAWEPIGFHFEWFSEISNFPSQVLKNKYPVIPNIGDMNDIPDKLKREDYLAPDVICGGTPCQSFSLAGWQNGLNDNRGNLTLKFVDIVNSNDLVREKNGLNPCVVFWENVEGVLTDKTNAFGCFVSSLAGLNEAIVNKRWPNAGLIRGPKRNVAWRVLDAKYFGLPQQRRRLYVLAGGMDFYPENVLFEHHTNVFPDYPKSPLTFEKNGHHFEVFREYTDCLYSAYGTKWNGNAAAYNGSLYIVQDKRIRRLSPLECERLMGFPDNYTDLIGAKLTNRYQAIGNSWAVPVIEWIGERLVSTKQDTEISQKSIIGMFPEIQHTLDGGYYYNFGGKIAIYIDSNFSMNCTPIPEKSKFSTMQDIVSDNAPEAIYISPAGCQGIIRRKKERNLKINKRLEEVLLCIASSWSHEAIERRSRVQKRGRFSGQPIIDANSNDANSSNILIDQNFIIEELTQMSLYELSSVI